MLRYSPPKSQVWGHAVSRLTGAEVVRRGLGFIASECQVSRHYTTDLTLGWKEHDDDELVQRASSELTELLGAPISVVEMPDTGGLLFRQCRWRFSPPQLAAIAITFDELQDLLKRKVAVARASTFWTIAWRDEPVPLTESASAGGQFGIHLGPPQRLTTLFSFRSLDQYAKIKRALSDLELAELSDRHLRPRVNPPVPTRHQK